MRIGQPPLMIFGMPSAMLAISPLKFVLFAQLQHRVDAAATPRRRRMRLHQHVHEMETLSKPLLDQLGLETVSVGAGKAALPFDDVVRPL